MRPLCRHCHHFFITRSRRLCWACFYTRELYPPTHKNARRGIGNGFIVAPLPARPTLAPPGSLEKVAVMERRAAKREQLFHPEDADHAVCRL